MVGRHFGESVFGSKLLPVENCRLADVGTGAGFPGLALKIFCPTIQLVLIDSNKKKCAFLAEIVRTLALSNVEILAERFEQIRPEKIAANVITSRAVGEFKSLLKWSRKALSQRGHVILWIGAEDSVRVSRTEGWNWQPAIRIPDSQRRFVLIGRPVDQ
jgi:16S rRNA (guanine527-N7)-methyltransferase